MFSGVSMSYINFVLICEGSSDSALVEHIKDTLIELGVDEVGGECPDLSLLPKPPGRRVEDKVAALESLGAKFDILFVHRDADNAGAPSREEEIFEAAESCDRDYVVVPVIPVKMLEAWLITDENAIREVAGNPRGSFDLGLPSPNRVESVADAKALLFLALEKASGLTGRKLSKFKRRMGEMRYRLAISLSESPNLDKVLSYQAFIEETSRAIEVLGFDTT